MDSFNIRIYDDITNVVAYDVLMLDFSKNKIIYRYNGYIYNSAIDYISIDRFTGTYDKTGRGIYENDIVYINQGHDNDGIGGAIFGKEIVVCESKYGGSWEPVSHGCVDGKMRPEWRIVGNIYKNSIRKHYWKDVDHNTGEWIE